MAANNLAVQHGICLRKSRDQKSTYRHYLGSTVTPRGEGIDSEGDKTEQIILYHYVKHIGQIVSTSTGTVVS